MSHLFRSRTMSYVRILMSDEAAVDTVTKIGEFGGLHVVDLSVTQGAQHAADSALSERRQRLKKRAAACATCERRLQSVAELFSVFRVDLPDSLDANIAADAQFGAANLDDALKFLDPFESSLSANVLFKRQQSAVLNELIERTVVLEEIFHPARRGAGFGGSGVMSERSRQSRRYGSFDDEQKQLMAEEEQSDEAEEEESAPLAPSTASANRRLRGQFTRLLCGTIDQLRQAMFDRLIFRLSRGNALVRYTPITDTIIDPVTGATLTKSVFSILFVGAELEKRLKRAIAIVGASEYEVPETVSEADRQLTELRVRVTDLSRVIAQTDEELHASLSSLAFDASMGISPWWHWKISLERERSICEVLRCCEVERARSRMLRCEGWIDADSAHSLQRAIQQATVKSQLQPSAMQILDTPLHAPSTGHGHGEETGAAARLPPTHFPLTPFTASFQSIVDTYGIPRYKEANPGLFTIISFPFLFGVMYGDIGHGIVLTIVAALLLVYQRPLEAKNRRGELNEILSMIFGGRHLLLLMGCFAVYCGLVYNDCFSIPLPAFQSSWPSAPESPADCGGVYPFGVDPRWYHSSNELAFFNSMKMKMSVILGVTQMVFGLVLAASNHWYNRNLIALVLELMPRMLFLLCTFGYMVVLIVYKWTIDFGAPHAPPAANLIQTMIEMFLSPGRVAPGNQLYAGQAAVQTALLMIALMCAPVMLLGVPLLERRRSLHSRGKPKMEDSHRDADSGDEDDEALELIRTRRKGAGGAEYKSIRITDDEDDDDGEELKEAKEFAPNRRSGSGSSKHLAAATSETILALPRAKHTAPLPTDSVSDALITQGIHTIEFVLGCVSNTASYLRLWALSLAHAQLASVFWQKMILQYGIATGHPVFVVVGFGAWCVATIAVLLCMDTLECFLHALRLHWVEFQNKFFHADGLPFEPFHLRAPERET